MQVSLLCFVLRNYSRTGNIGNSDRHEGPWNKNGGGGNGNAPPLAATDTGLILGSRGMLSVTSSGKWKT